MNLMEPIDEKYGIDYWQAQFQKMANEAHTYGVSVAFGMVADAPDTLDAEEFSSGWSGGAFKAWGIVATLHGHIGEICDNAAWEVEEDAE